MLAGKDWKEFQSCLIQFCFESSYKFSVLLSWFASIIVFLQDTCGSKGSRCYCDVSLNETQWQRDEGHLTNKSHLPVTQLNFGGLGQKGRKGQKRPREARFQLGPLYCSGADPGESGGGGNPSTGGSPSSCRDLWLRGNKQVKHTGRHLDVVFFEKNSKFFEKIFFRNFSKNRVRFRKIRKKIIIIS
jgi:hypothetical protein